MADEAEREPETGSGPESEIGPRRIAGVVLAAGASVRAGEHNKLLLPVGGRPMVRRVVEAAVEAALDPVVVVTGFDVDAVRGALEGLAVTFVHNDAAAAGMAGSLARGLAAVTAVGPSVHDRGVDGALILLGDMPWVTAAHLDTLMEAFDPTVGGEVCVPTHLGRRGNPVLWGARFFAEIQAIEGDVGARSLLQRHVERVVEVEMDDPAVLRDVDTLAVWRGLVDGGRIRRS